MSAYGTKQRCSDECSMDRLIDQIQQTVKATSLGMLSLGGVASLRRALTPSSAALSVRELQGGIGAIVWPGILKTVGAIVWSLLLGLRWHSFFGWLLLGSFYAVPLLLFISCFARFNPGFCGSYSIGHGANDAQKTMGFIRSLLFAEGLLGSQFYVPLWVVLSCQAAMAFGTLLQAGALFAQRVRGSRD